MKERITVTIDKKLLKWVDDNIERRLFANRSHAFEYLVARAQEEENQEEKGEKNRL